MSRGLCHVGDREHIKFLPITYFDADILHIKRDFCVCVRWAIYRLLLILNILLINVINNPGVILHFCFFYLPNF